MGSYLDKESLKGKLQKSQEKQNLVTCVCFFLLEIKT